MKKIIVTYSDPERDIERTEEHFVQDWQYKDVVSNLRNRAARDNRDAKKNGSSERTSIRTK